MRLIQKNYSHNVEEIIQRLKKGLNLEKDIDLAEQLGVAQNTISAWKKRNSINYELIITKCAEHDIDLNWLIYGENALPSSEKFTEIPDLESVKESLDERALQCVNVIMTLPLSASGQRQLIESYIHAIHKDSQSQESDSGDSMSKE